MQADPAGLQTVGALLRSAREARGHSLDQVAAKTRIRITFLRGLEQDSFEDLPPSVYVVGFIRNYCNYLGIDPAESIGLYHRQTATPGMEYMPDTRTPVGLGRSQSMRGALIVVASLVVLVIAANFVWRQYRSSAPDGAATPAATVTPAAATPTVLPPFRYGAPAGAVSAGAIHVSVVAVMNVNVRAMADGKPVFAGFLGPGEAMEWTANDSLSLIADNAGGLRVELNGVPQGWLGQVGQRFEREWRSGDQ